MKERYNDVITGLIIEKRHQVLGHHSDKFLAFVGKKKKLKELRADDLLNYYKYRLEKRTIRCKVAQ